MKPRSQRTRITASKVQSIFPPGAQLRLISLSLFCRRRISPLATVVGRRLLCRSLLARLLIYVHVDLTRHVDVRRALALRRLLCGNVHVRIARLLCRRSGEPPGSSQNEEQCHDCNESNQNNAEHGAGANSAVAVFHHGVVVHFATSFFLFGTPEHLHRKSPVSPRRLRPVNRPLHLGCPEERTTDQRAALGSRSSSFVVSSSFSFAASASPSLSE